MREKQVKYAVGVFLVSSHLVLLVLAVILRFFNGFDGSEFSTLLAVMIPMFSGYTSAIVTFIVRDKYAQVDSTPEVTRTYAAMSFIFPGVFTVLVAACILLQACKVGFEDFEQFKTTLLTLESAFAVYIGIFVYSMFEKPKGDGESP